MLKSSCPNNEGIVSLLHKTGEWGALLLSVVTGLLFIIISPEVSNDFIKSTALVSLIISSSMTICIFTLNIMLTSFREKCVYKINNGTLSSMRESIVWFLANIMKSSTTPPVWQLWQQQGWGLLSPSVVQSYFLEITCAILKNSRIFLIFSCNDSPS